uniref:Uncharacterized protein n=1 Tax=Arion vulgaris TaxID=1028688 RepID=A0A0B6ZBP3_9EUPU
MDVKIPQSLVLPVSLIAFSISSLSITLPLATVAHLQVCWLTTSLDSNMCVYENEVSAFANSTDSSHYLRTKPVLNMLIWSLIQFCCLAISLDSYMSVNKDEVLFAVANSTQTSATVYAHNLP